MTSYFCSTCGSLMYRRSSAGPDKTIMRLGTVDDFALKEEVLKPKVEQFTANRETYVKAVEGIRQVSGSNFPSATTPASPTPSYPATVPPRPFEICPTHEEAEASCDIGNGLSSL